jgi:hypothetical protein
VPRSRTRSDRSDRGRREQDAGGWYRSPLRFLQRIGWGPRDAVAGIVGAVAAVAILVNALFLQSGPHPAPLLKATLASIPAGETTGAVVVPRARPPEPAPAKGDSPNAAHPGGDRIADLLVPSRRVLVVQRALAQFGYGQIRPTGVVDAETRAAIEKFEHERKLPVTGQPSDRLMRELAVVTGRPLD